MHDEEGVTRHGIDVPRGQEGPPPPGGRFGRMFPCLARHAPDAGAVEQLARGLIRAAGHSTENPGIPAGYTYLGQFVDHDITFDPRSQLERDSDPDARVNFRTPRLDLDSLYGTGPADQPFLYDWRVHPGVKLLVGRNPLDDGSAVVDLPRNQQGRALIGDARNDENLITSQLHLLFIRFHNKVVDHLLDGPGGLQGTDLFEKAQEIVRWHYQRIVMEDFLPRIVDPDTLTAEPRFYIAGDDPWIPVEFSGAAFRFGHSMVRQDYSINDTALGVPIFRRDEQPGPHLGGFRRLPADLEIRWELFFPTTGTPPQSSMRIDPSLATALARLPDGAALARLNLHRASKLELPAGRDVADAMGETPLTADQLDFDGIDLATRIDSGMSEALLHATPLWYYVLREAQLHGGNGLRLGPVGGRIVAEVLTGLLEGDKQSYVHHQPAMRADVLPGTDGSFTMGDLVRFTEDG